MWYEIRVNGEKFTDVYREEDIIRESCELVNDYGVNPDDIEIITHK